MTIKSSGKRFENRVENLFLDTEYFNDDIFNGNGFVNVYNYREYMLNQGVSFEDAVMRQPENLFLFKNFPANNDLGERTEFCVCHKIGAELLKWRLECKFQDVNGSTHQKIEHGFQQFRDFKNSSGEQYYVMVYDGKHYVNKPDIVADVLRSIRYDHDMLFLNFEQFTEFLSDYLRNQDDVRDVFNRHYNLLHKL